jgi:hypothetical protein
MTHYSNTKFNDYAFLVGIATAIVIYFLAQPSIFHLLLSIQSYHSPAYFILLTLLIYNGKKELGNQPFSQRMQTPQHHQLLMLIKTQKLAIIKNLLK